MNKVTQIQPSESGLFNQNKLIPIKREGKKNIFSERLKKNLTKYLYDFFYIRELSEIGSTNIFLYNCFQEYELPNWKNEMLNIIDFFNLDIKNTKEEIDDSLKACIEKHRLYPMKDYPGNYIRIDKEGFNIISLVYYDPDMQNQLKKAKDRQNKSTYIEFNFEALDSLEFEEEINQINTVTLKTPWETVYNNNSYNPGNIIHLKEKSTLQFSFSFNHVIKGNYKLYLHQYIINMRNARLIIQIIINNEKVFEINNFPSKKMLDQFSDDYIDMDMNNNYINLEGDNIMDNKENKNTINNIKLKETYICDINESMFDSVKKNYNKKIMKDSFNSDGSTESNSSNNSYNSNSNDYTVRIQFKNSHLFWKGEWYLDGGRLVRSFSI